MTTTPQEHAKLIKRANVWRSFIRQRGPRYAEARLGNYDIDATEPAKQQQQANIIATLKATALEDAFWVNRNLLWLGLCGTGKDHLMTAMVFEAIRKDCISIRWFDGPSLFAAIKHSINDNAEAELVSTLARCELLCISDVAWDGAELTRYEQTVLYRIIDARYNACLSTYMTANVASRSQFEQLVGAQIVDRLCHDALLFICSWSSKRKTTKVIK